MNFVLVTILTVGVTVWETDASSSSPKLTQAALVEKLHRSQLNTLTGRSVTTASERLLDPTAEYSQQANFTARFGLQKCTICQTFAIVGAGPSGLIAGFELALAGHRVTLFEANNRTGGRVWTHREETTGLYMLEMGAMRLPLDVHSMLNTYIRERLQLELEPYINYDPETLVYINDVLTTRKQANDNPGQFKFNLYPNETNKSASTLWNAAVKPIVDLFYADRWTEALAKWDSYSVERYLREVAYLSADALEFVALLTNLEASLHTAILDNVLLHLVINDETKFYHIKDGNSGFTDALVRKCQAVPNGRCSIRLSTRVTAIELSNGPAMVTFGPSSLILPQNSSERFDHVIVATTATAAGLLDFKPRHRFIDTYSALRQLHYDCASKIGLYFTRQWWRDLGIDGGFSTSDLPVRTTIYFSFPAAPSPATLLASYAWSQDSIVWSSIPEETAIAMALRDIQRLHTTVNISQYFTGGIVKHWCQDQFTQGGTFAQYTPYQESKLGDALSTSVDNVHFVGEHSSSAHAWIEGAILSTLRLLMKIQEETFDVAIIGDHLVSLITALRLAQSKPTWRIALLPASSNNNTDNEWSQFRSNDIAAIQAIPLWRALETQANVSNSTFLNLMNGYLFLTDENSPCSDGCRQLNSTQTETEFGFRQISRGLLYSTGGYVNTTSVRQALIQLLAKTSNVVVRQNEYFVDVDRSVSNSDNHVRLITNRGSLNATQLVLVPGPNGNNISQKFDLPLNISLWQVPTVLYQRKTASLRYSLTWTYETSFSGLSLLSSNDVQISPLLNSSFISPYTDANQLTDVVDPLLITRTHTWVLDHLSSIVNVTNFQVASKPRIATRLFAGSDILDHLPACARYGSKTFIYAGDSISDSDSAYASVWAEMLTELVLGTSNSSTYTNLFSRMKADKLTCGPLTTTQTTSTITTSASSSSFLSLSVSVFIFLFILLFYAHQ